MNVAVVVQVGEMELDAMEQVFFCLRSTVFFKTIFEAALTSVERCVFKGTTECE